MWPTDYGETGMFGAFRLVLALMVVWYHLFDFDGFAGPVAVFAFYCLSGFLMAKIVNESYADGVHGFARYLANRALRIYPTYYVALALSAVVLLIWPEVAAQLTTYYMWPTNLLPQITIIGLVPLSPRILPSAWSLHYELLFYIAIGALLGRSRKATLFWFLASVEAPVALYFMYADRVWYMWYEFSVLGNSVAFAAGAMIYHFRDRLHFLSHKTGVAATFALAAIGLALPHGVANAGWLYVGLLAAAIAVAALKNLPQRLWDSRLGDLAYPLFLIHDPMAVTLFGFLGRNVATSILAVLLSLLAAFTIHTVVEKPIERWRAALRTSSGALAPAQ